jgi:hypothetical protein
VSTPTGLSYPAIYAQPPELRLGIIYNPFLINDVAKHTLVWGAEKTLADYLDGLPAEVAWGVAVDGVGIEPSAYSTTKVLPHSEILIVRLPEGGGGGAGKSILRIVALIAVFTFASWAAPLIVGSEAALLVGTTAASIATTIVTGAIVATGALLVNALLPQSLSPAKGPSSSSYGVDGPKNTAKEGVPVPIVLGTFRVGGNISDCYTRNIGNDQYLFMRTILHDGPVADISSLLINGQDINNYAGVEYRVNLGDGSAGTNSWFNEAIRLQTVQQQIDTTGVVHNTSGEVDRIRVDVAFPLGLYTTDSKGGQHTNTVTLVLEYQPVDQYGVATGGWSSLPLEAEQPLDYSSSSGVLTLAPGLTNASFTVAPAGNSDGTWSVEGKYRAVGSSTWISAGVRTGTSAPVSIYNGAQINNGTSEISGIDGAFANPNAFSAATSYGQFQYNFSFPSAGHYQVEFIGGAVVDNTVSNPNLNTSSVDNVPGQANSLTRTEQSTNPLRLTYQSATLTRGRYAVRIKRTTVDTSDPRAVSQCWVTDIGEIDNENVQYPHTAQLSLKIKLTNQLSSQPTVTALVTGANDVSIYDEDGNVLSTGWTSNPAWLAVWQLTNPTRGGGVPLNKISWPTVVNFAEFCDAQNLQFNGVFDFVTTLWDAVQSVARVGHGTMIPVGTNYGFTVDQPSTPVMLFSGANMFADTFQKQWVNLVDRANEVQQQFSDAADNYRQKTIRLPDLAAQSRGLLIKPATASGFGITNADQATHEAEYQARNNAYIRSTISFDAPLEAIGLSLGEVALIQHDSIKYNEGVGGRLEAGSTTTVINLDRPVVMNAGESYALMVVTDAVQRYSPTITAISQHKLTVTGLPDSGLAQVKRLKQGAVDVEVIKILNVSPGQTVITVEDATGLMTGAATLWDTDVIEERPAVTVDGSSSTITLASALPTPPAQYANFMFGQAATIQMPYRLRTISGQTDLTRRTLGFVQYDERVYGAGSWGTPQLVAQVAPTVLQVSNLHLDYDRFPNPDQQRIKVALDWTTPAITNYGGADIYVQINAAPWKSAGSVSQATLWSGDYNRNDVLAFKVVAYDNSGNRAPYDSAPIAATQLLVTDATLDAPTNLAFSVPTFRADASAHVTWSAPTGASITAYDCQIAKVTQADYDALTAAQTAHAATPVAITGASYTVVGSTPDVQQQIIKLDVGYYAVRIRSTAGYAVSGWVYTPVHISSPIFPFAVTNLQLNNGTKGLASDTFVGVDASWAWDDILAQATTNNSADLPFQLQDYQVQILDTSNNVLRTEYTTSPNYSYSLGKNQYDSIGQTNPARRSFKISVRIRGRQGQLSNATTQLVANPAPATPSFSLTPISGGFSIAITPTTELDVGGTLVWINTDPGQTLGAATYDDKRNTFSIATPDANPRYVQVAYYDSFDKIPSDLNIAAEQSVTPLSVSATSIPWTGVTGPNKPADNATVGSTTGVDLKSVAHGTLADADVYTLSGVAGAITGQGGQATANLYVQSAPPSAPKNNDLWLDQSTSPYTWRVRAGGLWRAGAVIFYGPTTPTGPAEGDQWMNTAVTPNALQRYSSGSWVTIATYGTLVGNTDSSLFTDGYNGAPARLRITDTYTPFGTASSVLGQGSLATKSQVSWVADVGARPNWMTDTYSGLYVGPKADYINFQGNGGNLATYWPATVSADKTHDAVSSGIVGQASTATSSDFSAVTGSTKPADNATVGAIWGSNLISMPTWAGDTRHINGQDRLVADYVWTQDSTRSLASYFPATAAADKTHDAVSSGIIGQGALAQKNTATWNTDMVGMPTWVLDTYTAGYTGPKADYIYNQYLGSTLQTYWPGTTGADKTSNANSAGFANQGKWATINVTTASAAPSSGNVVGDVWIDTTYTPNRFNRWNGSAWVSTTATDTNQLADSAGLGTKASWPNVTGAGRPADGATVGATWGSNLSSMPGWSTNTLNVGGVDRLAADYISTNDGSRNLATYFPATTGADRTANGVASAVVGQGALAQKNTATWNTDMVGMPTWVLDTYSGLYVGPKADYINFQGNGANLATYWPATTAADKTHDAVSSGILGQGPWAKVNVTTATSAPTSPTVGDIWIDTTYTPNRFNRWSGSAWVSTTATDTNQLGDSANLGGTAAWGGVSSRPAFATDLTGGNLKSGYITQPSTGFGLDTYWPATTGADRTANGVASGIAGQGSLARKNQATWNTDMVGMPAWSTDTVSGGVNGGPAINAYYISKAGDASSYLQNYWPATTGADKTGNAVAASVLGQGSLAQKNAVSWTADVSSRPVWSYDTRNVGGTDRLVADYIYTNDSGRSLAAYFPATGAADKTSNANSAGYAGQTNWGTYSGSTARLQYVNDSGTIVDGRAILPNMVTAQGYVVSPAYPLGSATPGTSITVAATTIYMPNYSLSLPSGTISGVYAATAYAVFWDTVASAYYAIGSGTAGYYTDNTGRYIAMGTVTTATSSTGAPPGGGGGGHPLP